MANNIIGVLILIGCMWLTGSDQYMPDIFITWTS
jgi:hypothetical protein